MVFRLQIDRLLISVSAMVQMGIVNRESRLQSKLSGSFEWQMLMADLIGCPWQSELSAGNLKGFVPE